MYQHIHISDEKLHLTVMLLHNRLCILLDGAKLARLFKESNFFIFFYVERDLLTPTKPSFEGTLLRGILLGAARADHTYVLGM